jgi:cysteine synthase
VAVMPESLSVERRVLMRAYGAKVVLTPAAEKASGSVRLAEKLAKERGWFLAAQFDNPTNPAFHRQTTAAEILDDFARSRLDFFVSGWGTGGTLTGVGQMLKVARPETKIVACEPTNAALLGGGEFNAHKVQGWTPDFIPNVLDRKVFDEIVTVTDDRAIGTARDLAKKEGIFCGLSGGATVAGALEVAARAPKDSVLLAIVPDTGERYLSTVLFEGVETGSDTV